MKGLDWWHYPLLTIPVAVVLFFAWLGSAERAERNRRKRSQGKP